MYTHFKNSLHIDCLILSNAFFYLCRITRIVNYYFLDTQKQHKEVFYNLLIIKPSWTHKLWDFHLQAERKPIVK